VISSAKTEDVYQNAGCAISKTIVAIIPMSKMISVPTKATVSVLNQNSDVTTQNVFRHDGSVTMMTTVVMDLMNENAKTIHAPQTDSNVTVDIV